MILINKIQHGPQMINLISINKFKYKKKYFLKQKFKKKKKNNQ